MVWDHSPDHILEDSLSGALIMRRVSHTCGSTLRLTSGLLCASLKPFSCSGRSPFRTPGTTLCGGHKRLLFGLRLPALLISSFFYPGRRVSSVAGDVSSAAAAPPRAALGDIEVSGARPQQSQEPLELLRVGARLDVVQVGVFLRGLFVFLVFFVVQVIVFVVAFPPATMLPPRMRLLLVVFIVV